MQPQPPEGQGGYARKVMDTAAERDRLREVNASLRRSNAALVTALEQKEPSPAAQLAIAMAKRTTP